MTRDEAVSQSIKALLTDEVEKAVAISSAYFGGAGSLYDNETAGIVRFILEHDYSPDPAIKPGVLQPLKVVAAATELWGQVAVDEVADVSGFWKYQHDPETVIRLLYRAGLEQHRLARLREMGARIVTLRSTGEEPPCPACAVDLGRDFPLDDAPFLPHRRCSCAGSCQCSYIAAHPGTEAHPSP